MNILCPFERRFVLLPLLDDMKHARTKCVNWIGFLVVVMLALGCERQTSKSVGSFAMRFATDANISPAETNRFELMSVQSHGRSQVLWVEKEVQLGGEALLEVRLQRIPALTRDAYEDYRKHYPLAAESEADFLKAHSESYGIVLGFTENTGEVLRRVTAKNLQRRLAVVVNGRVITALVIAMPIDGRRMWIQGQFTMKEANEIADAIRSGMRGAR